MNLNSNEDLKPFDFVLFGGTGDLSVRKLAVARSKYTTEAFREWVNEEVREHISDKDFDEDHWQAFLTRILYFPVDVTDVASYQPLAKCLEGRESFVRVFYLSVAPSLFTHITKGVQAAGLITPESRVALEKPLGRDQASAEEINNELSEAFEESQIYRIDHYLGKETVQNLLALRFGNALFEPLWRNERINDVQITIAESLGVEGRGGFYDQTGALRDMVQNHLLQLLVILAMEPPVSIDPDAVRDEKIKVLRALKPLVGIDAIDNSVRGVGRACLSTCVPVSAWRVKPQKSSSISKRCRIPFFQLPMASAHRIN